MIGCISKLNFVIFLCCKQKLWLWSFTILLVANRPLLWEPTKIILTIKISFANLSKFYKKKSNYSKLSWNFHQIVKLLTNKMPGLGRLIQCHSYHQLTYSFLVCLLFLVVGSYNIRFMRDFKCHFKLSPYSQVSKTFPSCPGTF